MTAENQVVALFIFIPFCKIKCTYCDFNVYANLSRTMEPYADAVVQEIRAWHENVILSHKATKNLTSNNEMFRFAHDDKLTLKAKSVYLGGGTPSSVPVAHIEEILGACQGSFALLPDAEITLEANPGTMDAIKLRDLRALGINRLSIGVQAFDDATLKRLNRGHTVADAMETYETARRAGFDNINLDFIYGLPLQTMDAWRATLERALALAPEHLSLYALKVEEGTGLEFQIKRGKYPMPDDDLAARMYELAEELLDKAGYEHYEISNWNLDVGRWKLDAGSRISNLQLLTSNFQSQHNLTYWLNQPYLGFGAGAHSYFGGTRYWNILSPLEYIARIERGESIVGGSETIDRVTEMAETMFLGLRLTRGLAFQEFSDRFSEDAREKYSAQLAELKELGLIQLSDEFARLTPHGRLLSNEVFWRFLP